MMSNNHLIVVLIIMGSAILGGTTNYFLLYDANLKTRECWIKYFASVGLSLCASFTVPLFLQILSNNLLDQITFKNALIFSGFCVLASFFSKRFLEDVYAKLKNLEKKVNKQDEETKKELKDTDKKTEAVNKKVEDLQESLEESIEESDNNIPTEIKAAINQNNKHSLDDTAVSKIIRAIFSAQYSARTIEGIAKETSIEAEKIKHVMDTLRELGFAESRVGQNGKDFWRLLKYPIKIYSANYGVPGHLENVTSIIQEQVTKGIYEGLVDPSTFRIEDPAWGAVKTLKIHCRIHGRERELSFVDGQHYRIA